MTWLEEVKLETIYVVVEGGPSVKGVKQALHDDCLVLRDALILHEEDSPEQLNGLYLIPRERVVGIQIISPVKAT